MANHIVNGRQNNCVVFDTAASLTETISYKMDYEEVKIPVPWGFIAGKWWGSKDRQPILSIHGWQDNAGTYDRLAPLLIKENISLLCIDLPGHGYSTHLPPGMFYYVFWDGVHFVRRIANHYKWKRIQMMGHSLGGAIAFLYASFYPNEIDCYIQIDIASPAVRDTSKQYNNVADIVDKFLKYESLTKEQMPCYEYEEMIDIVEKAYNGSCTRDSCEIMMRRGMQPNGTGNYLFSRDPRLKVGGLGMMDITQALDIARRIRCRVLNIRAEPGMKLDNPEYYDMVLDAIGENTNVEAHIIEGTHHLHLNTPESISQHIIDFLKR